MRISTLTLSQTQGTAAGCFEGLDQPTPSRMPHLCNTSSWRDQKSPGLPAGN